MATKTLANAAVLVSGDQPPEMIERVRAEIASVLHRLFGVGAASVVVKKAPSTSDDDFVLPVLATRQVKSGFQGELEPD